MSKRPSFEEFKKRAMQDKKFRAEYELLRPEFEILQKSIKARNKKNSMNKKYIAAAVIERNDKILIAQRPLQAKCHPGLWEFPGGKVEDGETLQECLKRELYEELGIYAEIGEYFCTSSFDNYEMCVFKVPTFQGEIKLNEHQAIAWVTPSELLQYAYPKPDLPIVELLQKDAILKK